MAFPLLFCFCELNYTSSDIPFTKLKVYGSFFKHAIRAAHPGMSLDIVKQLPAAMVDPLMIIEGKEPSSYVFVLEIKTNMDANIVVPVKIDKWDNKYGVINIAYSAFGKTKSDSNPSPSYQWFAGRLNKNEILYLNKEKSTNWVQSIRNSSPVGSTLLSSALFKFIINPDNNSVKTETDLHKR